MGHLNDPQIWTLIGVVTALIFASNRQLSTSIRREMETTFRAFETKCEARFDSLETKIDAVDAKIEALEDKMDVRFVDVGHRFESLEGDMHLIKAHLIGQSGVTPTRG